ncbi:MAG: response regulator [Fibrobacterales bacterium]
MESTACSILLVDDSKRNLEIMRETLEMSYILFEAEDGKTGIELAQKMKPDLILLDIMMPEIDGFEVMDALRKNPNTSHIPIIFITAKSSEEDVCEGLTQGAEDYITKPFTSANLNARVEVQLKVKKHQDYLDYMVKERTRNYELMQRVLIESMGTMAECRDPETGGHIKRTQNYLKALAMEMKVTTSYASLLTESYIDMLHMTAPLHDIGKIQIADSILLKPGKLTAEEFEIMKKHVQYGVEILDTVSNKLHDKDYFTTVRELVGGHHEKWDGSGYPNGLKGEDIPLAGRLMAIADVYDALISKRTYKEPFSQEVAVKIISESSGSHFDPVIVECFLRIQETFRNIALTYADYDDDVVGAEAENHSDLVHSILLVDDMEINLEIMKNQLESMGYAVRCALNGATAIESFNRDKPDLVLTDLEMPVANGYDVADGIRKNDQTTPIYLLTANDYNVTKEKLDRHQLNGYILKPLDETVLRKIISFSIDRSVKGGF